MKGNFQTNDSDQSLCSEACFVLARAGPEVIFRLGRTTSPKMHDPVVCWSSSVALLRFVVRRFQGGFAMRHSLADRYLGFFEG